jgi:hypothetical protein
METFKHHYGIDFSSEEIDLNKIRPLDLFTIVFNKLNPLGGDIPDNKTISLLIMQKGIKRVEIIRNRENKYILDARFYY